GLPASGLRHLEALREYAIRDDAVVILLAIPVTDPRDAAVFRVPAEQGVGQNTGMRAVTIGGHHEVAADLGINQDIQAEVFITECVVPTAAEFWIDITDI